MKKDYWGMDDSKDVHEKTLYYRDVKTEALKNALIGAEKLRGEEKNRVTDNALGTVFITAEKYTPALSRKSGPASPRGSTENTARGQKPSLSDEDGSNRSLSKKDTISMPEQYHLSSDCYQHTEKHLSIIYFPGDYLLYMKRDDTSIYKVRLYQKTGEIDGVLKVSSNKHFPSMTVHTFAQLDEYTIVGVLRKN